MSFYPTQNRKLKKNSKKFKKKIKKHNCGFFPIKNMFGKAEKERKKNKKKKAKKKKSFR